MKTLDNPIRSQVYPGRRGSGSLLPLVPGNWTVRLIGILLLLATAATWAVTFYGGLRDHLARFSKWLLPTMNGGG